jgi:hypothetical protein
VLRAEKARRQSMRIGKQALPRGPSFSLQFQVRPTLAAIVVGPGVALPHQPAGDIFTADLNASNGATVIVMAANGQSDCATRHPTGQGNARGPSTSLTNFGRVYAVDANWHRPAASGEPDPKRVSVGDMRYFSALCPYRISASRY